MIRNTYKNKTKGFSLVELVVVIAILVVLLAILAPSLLAYTENSRAQKDDSAMDEMCNSIQLAISDSEIFDEVYSYTQPNNYLTYSDSSGTYGAQYTDEEFWAPDGLGNALTITFNPNEKGFYDVSNALINNMTENNGSVSNQRDFETNTLTTLPNMGDGKLFAKLKQTIGTTLDVTSATYNNSSYTVFIKFDSVNGMKRANVYGEWNGTNLSPDCSASLGSGTEEYTPEGEAKPNKPEGGTTTPSFSNSDLGGGGSSHTPSVDPALNPNDGNTPQQGDTHITDDYKYTFDTEYDGWAVSVRSTSKEVYGPILESINGKPIKSLYRTFQACTNMKESPAIPNTVVTMESTYTQCSGLLKGPKIPASVTNMRSTFISCSAMTVGPDMTAAVNVSDMYSAFCACSSLTDISKVRIPVNITETNRIFMSCSSLTSVTIPNTVKTLGVYTLYNQAQLTNVILPEGLKTIGTYALKNNPSLTSITIPSSVTRLDTQSFAECPALTEIKFNGTMAQWHTISKAGDWNKNTPIEKIVCNDGTINS